jgi:predicted dehydrogenase
MSDHIDRRDFLRNATALGATSTLTRAALAARPAAHVSGKVIGANDRINVGVIGCGSRGSAVAKDFAKAGETHNARVAMVCDVYRKRANEAAEHHGVKGTLDYREVLENPEIDAVYIATPDHWHAPIAIAAMHSGKDVYVEKPMVHTVEEARQLVMTVRETRRVLQVGSQTTSGDQWAKARKAIQDGMIGKMIMSQGSYHRNSFDGEWNWPIDMAAGPDKKGEDYVDWKMWLGSAPARPWNADRYFRFRKYWDYSGGIATDLFYHVVAPMNICWGEPQFPSKVVAGGGIYEFHDEREVPDTFHLIGEYPKGHSIVLSSSMANSQHIPGLIRGHAGTIVMVEHGMFERYTPYISVKPEKSRNKYIDPSWPERFGTQDEVKIDIPQEDIMQKHIGNFLDCMRSREKPVLDVETGARAQVLITMSVMAYQKGRVLYFNESNWQVTDTPPGLTTSKPAAAPAKA